VDVQVGGDHYRKLPIQPMEYIQKNKLNFCEGSIVKYATRWRDKGGLQDLLKIKHCVDLLIEIEGLDEEEKGDVIDQSSNTDSEDTLAWWLGLSHHDWREQKEIRDE
jgi:hypothetical protein